MSLLDMLCYKIRYNRINFVPVLYIIQSSLLSGTSKSAFQRLVYCNYYEYTTRDYDSSYIWCCLKQYRYQDGTSM